MRYYIYLDKCFIRNIYSVIEGANFSIDVLELTEECGCRTNNNINIEPGCENTRDFNVKSKSEHENNYEKNIDRKRTNICYGYSQCTDNRKIKRYINIQDVTDIKCTKFYHNLLEKLRNILKTDKRVVIESGMVKLNSREKVKNINNNDILRINDSYVFFNKDEVDIDMELICYTECKLNVVGYVLNDNFNNGYKLLKAIAIYIE